MNQCQAQKELKTLKANIAETARSLLAIAHDYHVAVEERHSPWFKAEAIQSLKDALDCMKRNGLIKNYIIHSNTLELS